MKKSTKAWLSASIILILTGAVIFTALLWGNNWDIKKLSNEKFRTVTFDLTEDFDTISIKDSDADITFLRSDDNTARVVCYENIKQKHTASVENGALEIDYKKSKNWYDYITVISFSSPKITVYLPKDSYTSLFIDTATGDIDIPKDFSFKNINIDGSTCDVSCFASAEKSLWISLSTGDILLKGLSSKTLSLSTSTGKITASDVTADKVDIEVSTGDTVLEDINCKALNSSGDTGDISLKRVIAENKLTIKRDTGDVKLSATDAGEIFIETSTGDVKGSLVSDKVFIVKSDTGNINVPKTSSGGRCEIATDTGDIKIEVKSNS